MNILEYKNYLIQWIRDEVKNAKMNGVIVGISGGIDSAVVTKLAKEAFPKKSLGIIMPIHDMGIDLEHAKLLVKKTDIESKIIDLTDTFNSLEEKLNLNNELANANIKPRLRMTTLYALAQQNKYLVLGTDNKAEWILGYFTKYGDGAADILPLVHLAKRDVYELAKILSIPNEIIEKKPTAGLWSGQTDEEELGFSYDYVDNFIYNEELPIDIKNKILKQIAKTNHKRNPLPIPKKYK